MGDKNQRHGERKEITEMECNNSDRINQLINHHKAPKAWKEKFLNNGRAKLALSATVTFRWWNRFRPTVSNMTIVWEHGCCAERCSVRVVHLNVV